MKKTIFFAALLTVAAGYPLVKTWTLHQLSEAIETKKDPALTPYLTKALNQIMLAIFTGNNTKLIHSVIPSPSGSATWTVEELKTTLEDRTLPHDYRFAVRQAYDIFKERNATGEVMDTIEVAIPALDVSLWSANDLNEAIRNPDTNPDLIPYLEKARTEMKESHEQGNPKNTVGIVTPVGLIPHKVNYEYEFKQKSPKFFNKKSKKVL